MPTDQNLDQIAAITTLAAGDQFYVETAAGADGRATASQIREFISSLNTVAASTSLITLTANSSSTYVITGSGGQIIKLPDATTLKNGATFSFNNNQSSGTITVNNGSVANTLVTSVPSGGYITVVLTSNATIAGVWDKHDQTPSNVSWSTNTFNYPGSITGATWNGNPVKGTLGTQVKVVGIDGDGTIQSCINLCTSASLENPYTVLIPPKASGYSESLVLKGSVSLVGLTTALNAEAVQITGEHYFTPLSTQANTNRINFQNLTFISSGTNNNTITCSSSLNYFSKLTFFGCIFSGNKADTFSHLITNNNVAVYVDNCRFESIAGGSASAGITHGNGPLYLSNNTTFDVFGRALDILLSVTEEKTATSTTGSTTLTVSDVIGVQVGDKISGTGLYSTTTVVSIPTSSTVVMSTTPQTATSNFTATFGQTPYVEIHDSVLAGKGAETVRLGNGLLTCNTSNFTNKATLASSGLAGNGINIRLAGSTVGIVNSSFTISDTNAYTITTEATGTLPLNAAYAALNGVSYSNLTGYPFSTKIGANVIVLDYSARATSVANGGTGQTTYTNGQLLIGNTTGNTLSKATLTAGTGITVTNGAGSITLANTGAQLTANTFTATQTLAAGTTAAAPAKFQAGARLTTPAAHSLEWDGATMSVTALVSLVGTWTTGTNTVTITTGSTSGLVVGAAILSGITGTTLTIASITGLNTFTLSGNATNSGTTLAFTVANRDTILTQSSFGTY